MFLNCPNSFQLLKTNLSPVNFIFLIIKKKRNLITQSLKSLRSFHFIKSVFRPDSELSSLSLQTTESGSSIYKVQAVDKDTGSGGSVTYYLQVQKDDHTQHHIYVHLYVRQEQLVESDSGGGEVANIWTQQLSPAGTVVEHMGSLHPDGHQDRL